MTTKYRHEIREKVRMYLRERGRVDDARRIGRKTSMEKLRVLLSFSNVEAMYNFFDHEPSINNPDGNPGNAPIPCYLLFGETSVKVTRFESGVALTRHIDLEFSGSHDSIGKALQGGGSRIQIGKYIFAITRNYTTAIESIPISKNNSLNVRIAAKLGGVPNSCVSMHDIAKNRGVRPGIGVTKRLCKYFGIKYHKIDHPGNSGPMARPTTLTNVTTGEVLEYVCMKDACIYLRIRQSTLEQVHERGETVTIDGNEYSILIVPKAH